MDSALKGLLQCTRRNALLVTALSPVVPQLLGSYFNIWYNGAVVNPLLSSAALQERFVHTVIAFNGLIYPIAVFVWWRLVYAMKGPLRRLQAGLEVPKPELDRMRRRAIHLPWLGALVSGAGWLACIPIFLVALWQVGHGLDARLLWHLPISFIVSAFISVTHSFFLVEIASHWTLFPIFFRDVRADKVPGVVALSLRGRGLLWAVSAGICPIGSLLLLSFAPPSPETNPQWFAVFVGTVGIAFGLCTAMMMGRLVAEPVDNLRAAAQAVAEGHLDVEVPMQRADEFGQLAAEFNRMIRELREKERLRQTFGLHVGRRAAEQILARDPGLNGVEEVITVLFLDIRSFTTRSANSTPQEIVGMLNRFLREMVNVVEEGHGGMINKFLGDGFLALFGVGDSEARHADDALAAAVGMLAALAKLNAEAQMSDGEPLQIGIGIHTGPAVVGSIGSPKRLEFTAIGETVNLASRIEGLTKQLGYPVLLTRGTQARLGGAVPLLELGPQQVRGLAQPVEVFALQG